MASTIARLNEKGVLELPGHFKWLRHNIHYECYIGSVAYGASNDNSDMDVTGWCIPTKEIVFPHTAGYIYGFGDKPPEFGSWQRHHVIDKEGTSGERNYDFAIYGVVKYFQLCMEGNPNMIDSLFVPQRCILHETELGHMVRENRRVFLHKGCWPKFKGYAYSQLNKIEHKDAEGKRKALIDEFGYDVKFGYHVVRLLLEIQQILEVQDLKLDINGAQLREIREGKWTLDYLRKWAEEKMHELEAVHAKSDLRPEPAEGQIKDLLLKVLTVHFGDLEGCVVQQDAAEVAIEKISEILSDYREGK